jgi:hypothetical protein
LAAISKLGTLLQWKLLFYTNIWKIKTAYAFAMLERYSQLCEAEDMQALGTEERKEVKAT